MATKLNLIYITKNAEKIWHEIRWNKTGVYCPYCGSVHIYTCSHGYKCADCNRRFTDKTNTLLHGSKLDIVVWITAIFIIHLHKGISSVKLAKDLGINQKSAWLLLSKIRYAMGNDDIKLSGTVCIDEAYIGGSFKNIHFMKKMDIMRKYGILKSDEWKYNKKQLFQANARYKQPVFGLNDGKHIKLVATPNPIKDAYIRQIFKNSVDITDDTLTICDESKLYNNWMTDIEVNNHSKNRYYTSNGFTSNPIENTFSWMKRTFKYNYTHFKKDYTQLYLNEYSWRYNRKELTADALLEELGALIINNSVKYSDIKNFNQFKDFEIKEGFKPVEKIDDFEHLLSYSGLISSVTVNGSKYPVK